MRQELFRIGPIPVHGYGTLVLIGVLTGLWLLSRNARRRGWNPQAAQDCAVFLVLGGILGGRTFHFIQYNDTYESPLQFFALWNGGLVLYGGLLGGLATCLILSLKRGMPVLQFLDLLAPSVAVGIGFGRLGCLMNGCCWGRLCYPDFPFGISFPLGSAAASHPLSPRWVVDGEVLGSMPLQPTQIYASINAFILAWILWRISRPRPDNAARGYAQRDRDLRKRIKSAGKGADQVIREYLTLQREKWSMQLPKPGFVIGTAALLYGCSRFLLESIRGDHHPEPGAWTVSQIISGGMVLTGMLLLLRPRRASERSPSESPHALMKFGERATDTR